MTVTVDFDSESISLHEDLGNFELINRRGRRPLARTARIMHCAYPKQCHRLTAFYRKADPDVVAWTGFAYCERIKEWIEHSWIVDGNEIIEPTPNRWGTYFGAPAPDGWLDAETWDESVRLELFDPNFHPDDDIIDGSYGPSSSGAAS